MLYYPALHTYNNRMSTRDATCTIAFTDEEEKARAFYALIHSGAQFSGVGKDTFVVARKDCRMLKSKNIKYREIA